METCLVDSSIWVSYFSSRDVRHGEAVKIMGEIIQSKCIITLPMIIYIEVINALQKLQFTTEELVKVESELKSTVGIQYVVPQYHFWIKIVRGCVPFTSLKALDLIILSFALEYKVDRFYTFDKQLREIYENFKQEN